MIKEVDNLHYTLNLSRDIILKNSGKTPSDHNHYILQRLN